MPSRFLIMLLMTTLTTTLLVCEATIPDDGNSYQNMLAYFMNGKVGSKRLRAHEC